MRTFKIYYCIFYYLINLKYQLKYNLKIFNMTCETFSVVFFVADESRIGLYTRRQYSKRPILNLASAHCSYNNYSARIVLYLAYIIILLNIIYVI